MKNGFTLTIGAYLDGERVGEYRLRVANSKEALVALKILASQEKSFKLARTA